MMIANILVMGCLDAYSMTRRRQTPFLDVLVRKRNLLMKEGPHLQKNAAAELPLWVERKHRLGLPAAQADKSSNVVQGR